MMGVIRQRWMEIDAMTWRPSCQLMLALWMMLHALHYHRLPVCRAQSVVLYQKAAQCPGKVLTTDRTYDNFVVRSKVQCAALCLPDFSCHSFLFNPEKRHCHLGSESSLTDCSNMTPALQLQHYDMTTSCRNGGVLQAGGSCVCPHGFMGQNCNSRVKDCTDIYNKGNIREDGVYWAFPTLSPYPFPVHCRMMTRPRTYLVNRIYNDVNFNRGWHDYSIGFGNLSSDFWLGLDKIHYLTTGDDYELRFRVRLRSNTNLFQVYKHVKVANEEHNYRLSFSEDVVNGSLGDCLGPLNGANFSTPDRDNDDNDLIHCGKHRSAGFWFRGDVCSLCNPTGILLQPLDQLRLGIPGEVFWMANLGQTVPYKISVYLVNVLERQNDTV